MVRNNIDKFERNAKAIKTIISLLVVIACLIYGFCIFIYQNQSHSADILDLKARIAKVETESTNKHHELEQKIALNEKDFQMLLNIKYIKMHLHKGLNLIYNIDIKHLEY